MTFQHPTPYFDDSYAVNSVNNGPYGDAILTELIPYLETHFRMALEALRAPAFGRLDRRLGVVALQLYHPDFFGGTWTLYPDPISFEHYQLVNIYKDDNAFFEPGLAPSTLSVLAPRTAAKVSSFFRPVRSGQVLAR